MRIIFAQGTNSAVSIHTNNPAVGHGVHQQVVIGHGVHQMIGMINVGTITMTNDSIIEALSIVDLDTIEIRDGSTATVTLDFSLENLILADGTLNLTVHDQDPCTGILEVADGTNYMLNSASGFKMTIISPTGGEYVLATGCK